MSREMMFRGALLLTVACVAFGLVLCDSGCNWFEGPPVAQPDHGTNTNIDSDQHQSGDVTTTLEICSVELVFNFNRQVVSFYNWNDSPVIVKVWRLDEYGDYDGQIVENWLWNDGMDTESAAFDHGDVIEIVVTMLDFSWEPVQECDVQQWTLG